MGSGDILFGLFIGGILGPINGLFAIFLSAITKIGNRSVFGFIGMNMERNSQKGFGKIQNKRVFGLFGTKTDKNHLSQSSRMES